MPTVDLTSDFKGERYAPEIIKKEVHLKSGLTEYTGIVYDMKMDGMTGTYIDFPGIPSSFSYILHISAVSFS